MEYKLTVGLEVHAELKTKSKMFCGCKNEPHASEPNTNICPVCLAHPGTLPVPNQAAIEKVLMFGQAVGATAASYSEFDRKNYFYPDIPKAYQISQYAFPFLTGGSLCGVALTRVHLEEDTARSQHDKGDESLVDFNRAGVPLMELVTEPVIHDAKTAGDFARELQLLLRTLGISDANMEKGEMRVEANISLSADPDKLGTKVEVKNLNSFKSVESAIHYEVKRQTDNLFQGIDIKQETRGWDENKQKTFSQRSKETAKDYRYFPDPDIPKISVDQFAEFKESRLNEIMPKTPENKRISYRELGLEETTIETIIANQDLDRIFVAVLETALLRDPKEFKLLSNYISSDVASLQASDLDSTTIQPKHLAELIQLLVQNKINSRVAKDLLPLLLGSTKGPLALAEEKGLLQVSDEAALKEIVAKIVEENESVAAEYKAGKEASLKFLLGQGMKVTKGSANPQLLTELLKDALK